MKKFVLLQKSRIKQTDIRLSSRNELIGFVADQFKKLSKKNLKVPIQLYHL